MTIPTQRGNNFYIGWYSEGHRIDDIPVSDGAVYIEVDTGVISHYHNGGWNTALYGGKTDLLFATWQIQSNLNNIGTAYKDIYPSLFEGCPLGLDTSGYRYLGIVVAWGKNGGGTAAGRHDLRIVNNANELEVLVDSEATPDGMVTGTRRYYSISIPPIFKDFRGEIKLQAKSDIATDSPIFYGLWLYLIR